MERLLGELRSTFPALGVVTTIVWNKRNEDQLGLIRVMDLASWIYKRAAVVYSQLATHAPAEPDYDLPQPDWRKVQVSYFQEL